jgi:serine/threonine protein kinase
MSEFTPGANLPLTDGGHATVVRKLGEGGQGIVYEVTVGGKPYALKWYTCKIPNEAAFKKNLLNNVSKGPPDEKFLWPLFLTREHTPPGGQVSSFGYLMGLRPKNYSDFSAFLNAEKHFPLMEQWILAALNIVHAFRKLHIKGFSYQDLNDGNFFIDFNTGDVLVCDNDNVTPGNAKNPGGVGGKPGYMAPEVVMGNPPNTLTDYYSLSVILFKLFFVHDPLMGALYHKEFMRSPEADFELYGRNPVFIFDPNNQSNRPVSGVDNNPLLFWPYYPQFLRDAFIKSFVEGIKNPSARLTENVWQKILIQLRDEFSVCPHCKESLDPWAGGTVIKCGCGVSYSQPERLHIGQYHIPIFPGQKLYACHTVDGSSDFAAVTGEVVTSKKNAGQLGIKNLSGDTWSFTGQKGEVKTIAKGEVAPVFFTDGITFKKVNGKIGDGAVLRLFINQYQINLAAGQKLYACHTVGGSSDASTVTGEITSRKSDPNQIGIRNLSDDVWTFALPNNEKVTLEKGKVIPLKKDMDGEITVNFKDVIGKIAKQ